MKKRSETSATSHFALSSSHGPAPDHFSLLLQLGLSDLYFIDQQLHDRPALPQSFLGPSAPTQLLAQLQPPTWSLYRLGELPGLLRKSIRWCMDVSLLPTATRQLSATASTE